MYIYNHSLSTYGDTCLQNLHLRLSINIDVTSQLENSIQGGGRLQVPQQAAGHRQPQQHFRQFLQQFRDYQVADRKC